MGLGVVCVGVYWFGHCVWVWVVCVCVCVWWLMWVVVLRSVRGVEILWYFNS